MGRSRAHVRRSAHAYPSGTLAVYADGYGFVRTSEGEFFIPEKKMNGAFDGDLVEVSPLPRTTKIRNQVYDQDTLQWVSGNESPAARVVRVIGRAHETVVGRYEVAEPFGVVVPLDYHLHHDIFTLRKDNPSIPDGALVRVRITTFPTGRTAATGVIEEVLDEGAKQEYIVDALIERNNLETVFSEGALKQARDALVDEQDALRSGYRDIRDRVVFTIDPDDARDFDDAISLERAGGDVARGRTGKKGARIAWRLGVHIADVAHYVAWDSSIDLDARRRATSVYLVDRVLPMLPEALSNDLCSLKPGATRRCMTVDLYLDEQAEVVGVDIYPALMESRRRMTYDEVLNILETDASVGESVPSTKRGMYDMHEMRHANAEGALNGIGDTCKAADASDVHGADAANGTSVAHETSVANGTSVAHEASVANAANGCKNVSAAFETIEQRLFLLSEIAQKRRKRRKALGAPEFSRIEAKVRVNDRKEPIAVELHEKNAATELVEEAMIMANQAVARYLVGNAIPGLFRVHEAPLPMNCASLVPLLEEFPWFSHINKMLFSQGDSFQMQKALELSRGRAEEELVSYVLLRAMKQAVYSPVCEGHFGLATDEYLHFTSPIRRYPDLVVHRMLKAHLEKRRLGALPPKQEKAVAQEVSQLAWLAEHSSKMERLAEKVSRESHEYLLVEYMQQFVGQRFSATISGVASYGIYVRLDNTAEGLLPLKELGREYFIFDGVRHMLVGEESGTVYRLAQRVAVILSDAHPLTRDLTFKLCRNQVIHPD